MAYAHGLKRGGGIIPRFSPTFWDVRDELIRSLENSVVGGVRESFIASERLAASRPPAVSRGLIDDNWSSQRWRDIG